MEACVPLTSNKRVTPPGIVISRNLSGRQFQHGFYRGLVLLLTFIAYACYHACRKPPSIVKSVLDPEQSEAVTLSNSPLYKNAGWAPFNGKNGKARLGEIDLAFLAVYAFGMFFAGHLGDRMDLRVFLTIGMIGSGIFVCLFGMGYWWNIHNLQYFLFVQIMAGLFQATGWPSVVAIVGNWFGKSRRGLIMGVWNAHTSVGNIVGSLVAASALEYGWGYSFLFPGLLIIIAGAFVYMFLVVEPADVGLPSPSEIEAAEKSLPVSRGTSLRISEPPRYLETALLPGRAQSPERGQAVGFLQAWKIPGVAPFAMCLFFCKLVAYTFLYWLPFYLRQTRIAGKTLSEKSAGNLSTLFDIGGVVGGILAGYASDRLNARAITAATLTYCAIPALLLYRLYGSMSMNLNVGLMMLTGMLVNGPYSLITTAVSADLGTHSSLKGDARALATVTAIIDGCGSLGAAIGPLLTGYLSTRSWDSVFIMLMVSAFVAGLLLSKLVAAEAREKISSYRNPTVEETGMEYEFLRNRSKEGTIIIKTVS